MKKLLGVGCGLWGGVYFEAEIPKPNNQIIVTVFLSNFYTLIVCLNGTLNMTKDHQNQNFF